MQPAFEYGERGHVVVVEDGEALAQYAATLMREHAEAAIAQRGRATIALSGGSTPKRMGELFAAPEWRDLPFWAGCQIFWGDERWVPLESPESNAGVAIRTFLGQVAIPADQVHPMPTVGWEPGEAASAYAALIRELVPTQYDTPSFDLVFLGMGDDCHTASLFPQTAALQELNLLVTHNYVPKLDANRLTLTSPTINNARSVVFLVGGASKAEPLQRVLEGPIDTDLMPSQLIQPEGGALWVVDRAAAANLTGKQG